MTKKHLLQAIYTRYSNTAYTPKIEKNLIGSPIETKFGVTQGRKSSGNLYAFAISDLPKALKDDNMTDFMDPYCVAQLADDTSITSESLQSQTIKFQKVIDYATIKHQHINTKKTKYMNMSSDPVTTPIILNDDKVIDAVDIGDGYNFLGFKLTYSNNIYELVENNLKSKLFNIAKFYAWMEYNEKTPFFIKLKVLYGCVFPAILYSAEAWGDLNKIESTLRATETKALKACLGVKSGTTSDVIYAEINRPDIISIIQDRQYNFRMKIENLNKDEALMKEVWDLCDQQDNENLCHYYRNIQCNNAASNLNNRKSNIELSDQTMNIRYRSMIGFTNPTILYDSCLDDEKRKIITRWRLSSHKLRIETGRYTNPKTLLMNRLCKICSIIEDERHAIYHCRAHISIRKNYQKDLDLQNDNISRLLNPVTISNAISLAKYLNEIEKNMEKLNMIY